MTTIADVARLAGVSASTVSHVVNATRPVAAETRRMVLETIEATGYVPNRQARSLVRSQSQLLGLAISVMTNPYFGDLVHGIEAAASAAGYTLLLGDTHEDPAGDARVVQALRERRVDGLLLAPSAGSEPLLDRLLARGLPTLLVDRFPDCRFDAVCTENREPMARLVAHLAATGHRDIAMVSGRAGLTTTDERLDGYRDGLASAGLAYDSRLVVSGGSDAGMTYTAVRCLLDLPRSPTALVAANNTMVVAALRVLRERGIEVPGDLAVVAFDDFAWADVFTPRLTTVAQDCRGIGRVAVELLLERIGDRDRPVRSVRVPAAVVHRDSCGCGAPGTAL